MGETTSILLLLCNILFNICGSVLSTCSRPEETFVVFNGRWYLEPSGTKAKFAEVRCPTGSRMATAKNEEDYKAIIHFYQKYGSEMWIGFKDPSGGNTCTNAQCTNLIEWVDGTKFTYQSYMTEGIEMKSGADCFALFGNGKIVGETGCNSRDYSYLCQSICEGANPPCAKDPPPVGGSTKRNSDWDQVSKDFGTSIRYECIEGFEFPTKKTKTMTVTCLENGQWSEVESCEPIKCNPDEDFDGLFVKPLHESLKVSSRKELHCMDGFTVSPESENTTFFVNCETNGKSAPEIQFEKCVPSYCFSHWDELNDRNMSLGPIRTYKIGKQAWLHCDNASHITYNESIDMPIHVGVTCTVENLTAPFWETDIDLDQVECKANEEVCILTAEDLKIPNAKPYEEYPVGYWVGMEDHFYFSCEKDYYLAADRSKTNFSIFCYEDDKKIPTLSLEQANPNVVPNLFQCVSNVECPSDLFVNPSEHGFEGLKTSSVTYHFNDTVSLTCPGEYEMLKISTNKWVRTLDFQCQWNTSWTPYVNFTDLKCEDRSCQGAPRAPPSNGLEGPYLNGQFIPKHCYPRFKDGEQATYRCQEGYRLNTSHSQMSLALTCEPPHIQEAIWPHCISVTNCSKKHSGNATVYIHSRIVTEPLNYNFTPSVGDLGKPHLNLFWDTKWWKPVEEVVFYLKQIVPRTIFPNKTLKFCSKTCSMVDSDLSGWTYMIVFNCSQSASCFKTSFLVDEPTFEDSLSRIEIVRRKAVPSDYSDCAEFYRNGYAGLDRSILNSRRKWDRCEMGWTEILQRRLIEKQNFSTEDFQNVFINKSFFWKGLLNIKEMTNEKQQELKIEFFKSNGEKTQIRYDFFRIEEQGNYPFVLHIGQPDMLNSNVPDSFSVLNGTNFQSNFNLSNCGLNKTFHGWLNQCLITVDLFGEEFVWMGLDQSDELKAIKMAIRPQEFNESVMEDIQWILNNAPYNYGDQAQLFCRPGYELIDPGADSFTCDWEPNDPNYVSTCIAKSCPYLPHEKINLTNMIPILKGNTNEVLINKTISYHCKPGTFFEDNMTRTEMSFTCQPNMTYEYNRTQLTSCIWEKKCKNWPEKPLNGQIAVAKMPQELVGTCRGYLKPAIFPFCTSAYVTWHYVYSNNGQISMNISVSSSTNEPILLVFSHALNASNSSIAMFQNSSSQALLLDNFRFDPNSSDHLPCILNAFCGTNLSHFETLNENSQTELGYHEAIRYSCNETQRFQRPNGSLEKWTFLRCDWTGQWLDSQGQLVENLDPCITVACPNPPAPPNETFLRLLNPTQSNQVVLINNSVTYKCQQGWKLGPDSQRDIYFNLTCLEDGNYSTDWPICENPNTKLCPPLEAGVPNGNYSVDNTSIPVQTEITFDCDWGFSVSANASFGNRTNATSQRFTCFWNQTWDTTLLHPCERTHCTAPPNITYFHLSPVNLTSAVSVGDTVMYKCDSNNRFFENDKFQRHLGLTCQLDGLFYPLELTRCLLESEVICTDPPPLPPTGINRFWDENDNYFNSTAKYVCQTHRESISESVVESVCQWNKTWTQKIGSLNCSYTHCPRLPNPPLESGIFYSKEKSLANELDFVYDYRFGQPSPNEDYVLPIPPKFKDRVLVIDGFVSREETNQSTQLILMNYINKGYNEIYSIDLEPWLFGGGSEEYFLLQIVQRNSSALNITNMETGIHRLQYNPEFNGLRLNGTVTINFIGFVLPGEAYAIPVGDTIAFVCPLDQVLTSKPYLEATLTLVCGTNGEFDVPNPWPKCVSFEEAMNTTKVEIDFHPPMKFPTSDDENVIVTLPTNNPALGPVEYPHTTRYHWPNFDLNATDPNPEDFEVVSGPNLFREAVELKQGHDKCLIDKEFAAEDDTCIRNPVNCEDGFSFSLFFKPNYDLEPHQFFNASKTFFQEYIVSTGGDKGSPGFGIYIQGGDIGAVVSTGVQVWKVQVKGGAPDNKTWTNLAIKWEPPLFNTEDELEELLTVKKKKFHELGGLQLYRNLELIGQTFHPDEDVEESGGEQFDQPEIMIGCHRTPQDDTPRKFSHGSYDELAFWARALNATEEVFFLGGYKDVFEDVGTDDLLKILNFIDYADVNQADTAINIMDSIVNGEEEEEEEFRNIYPETTPTPSESTEDENGTTSTVSSSTTTTTTEAPKKDSTKDVKNLMKIAKKLTSTDSLNYYITKREFDVRMKAVAPLGEFMGVKGKYAEGWTALKKDKNEAGPFETLTNLKNYVKYNVERYTVVPPDSRLRETRNVVSTNNFVMEAFKMTSTNFGKLGSVHNGGYFQFPNWNSPEWAKAKASFGYTQGQDRPTESVDISSELFTEECKKNDVNFVGMISDTFPDHGRKNPSFIYANHIELDSRVITLDITANKLDTDPDSPTFNKFGERCEIDPKLAVKDPFILKFAIKSKRNHDFGRKLTSYYDSFDDKRVNNRHCVIWNEDIGPYGAWDTRGVTLVKADDAQATCYATKLGIYAIVAEIEDVPYAEDDETWLNIVKYIGYAISIILLLIFIGVILSSTYLWEMFHLIAVNMAFSLLFGHIFMLISELDAVRDDRDACSAIGLLILFFYSALSVFITMECYAMFKAIISGIIGGHTRTYLCFGYGVPLLHIGVSIFIHLQEMGTDPRCMVGWANEVKEAFYIPVAIFGILSVFLVLVMVCNINTPAMRKESMVEELGSLAKGLGVFVLLYALTWSWFPFAYMRFPTQEFPDFYPAFQVMNSFMGMFFFVFIGLMSNRFRTALTGGILMRRKALLVDESADDNYVEQVNEDSITTMDDIEPEDDEDEEDVEAAPRSRPESGKSVIEEQSENPDPDLEDEDVVSDDPVEDNTSPDPNPNEAEKD